MRPPFLRSVNAWQSLIWPYSIRLLAGLALGLLSLFVFAKISEDLLFHELQAFDVEITRLVRFHMTESLTLAMKAISDLGSAAVITGVGLFAAGYLLFVKKFYWDALQIPVVLIGASILNTALKILFHRPRPLLPHLVQVSGLSYPSGHAMVSFAFYGLLIFLIRQNVPKGFFRSTASVLLGMLIVLIGTSRIYLGVHYPSDVLAGFAAGSAWMVACILGLKGIRVTYGLLTPRD